MTHTKECKFCGHENNISMTNCMVCKNDKFWVHKK